MSNGIYVALSANVAIEKNLEVTSHNLSNVDTAGFKKSKAVFSEYVHKYSEPEIDEKMEEFGVPKDKSFVELSDVFTDFKMGHLKETGNSLDLAISGDAFFMVSKDDQQFLQRSGTFTVNNSGQITAYDGAFLLNRDGAPITVDPKTPVHINEAGEIYQNNQLVTSLKLSTVDDKRWLEKMGDNRYVKSAEGGTQNDAKADVLQGYLEAANVNMVAEMVEMIKIQRHYETAAKAIKAYDNMDSNAIKVGTVG